MSEYPWMNVRLAAGSAIDRAALDRMTTEAPDELARFHARGVSDLLIVPVLHRSHLMGAIGLVQREGTGNTHAWDTREVSMLAIAGALLMRIVDRLRSHAAVERSAARYQALSERLEQLVEERTRELRDLQAVQVELDKHAALGRMAATVAHEINNPLAGVVNALALVRDAVPPDDPRARYMGMIERETSRIADTVQQLFDLYRPGVPESHRFDLATAVADVVALLNLVASERAVHIHTDVAPGVRVRLPESLVRQVLFNLVRNAIDASPNGGVVRVVAGVNSGALHFSIADSGPGIAPEVVERVFDAHYTTKQGETAAGLGLGLTITRDIVNSLGGSIHFDESGAHASGAHASGAHVRVELPLPVLAELSHGTETQPGITTEPGGDA